MKKKLFKTGLILMCSMTLGTVLLPTVSVFAQNISVENVEDNDQFDPNFKMDEDFLRDLELTEEEIESFNNYEESNIVLNNGDAFLDGKQLNTQSMQRDKFTWAVKAIRKSYNRLPKKVKQYIAKYTKLNTLLNIIEHYTGKLEDAIYSACKRVGMPNWMANFVTKTIMLFVF